MMRQRRLALSVRIHRLDILVAASRVKDYLDFFDVTSNLTVFARSLDKIVPTMNVKGSFQLVNNLFWTEKVHPQSLLLVE